jgi:hypothetical protein
VENIFLLIREEGRVRSNKKKGSTREEAREREKLRPVRKGKNIRGDLYSYGEHQRILAVGAQEEIVAGTSTIPPSG